MANHKSAIKRIQTNTRDNMRNKVYMSTLKTLLKKVRAASTKEEAESQYRLASSKLDKLVNKGIIHRNKAANQKSRLAAHVKNIE